MHQNGQVLTDADASGVVEDRVDAAIAAVGADQVDASAVDAGVRFQLLALVNIFASVSLLTERHACRTNALKNETAMQTLNQTNSWTITRENYTLLLPVSWKIHKEPTCMLPLVFLH